MQLKRKNNTYADLIGWRKSAYFIWTNFSIDPELDASSLLHHSNTQHEQRTPKSTRHVCVRCNQSVVRSLKIAQIISRNEEEFHFERSNHTTAYETQFHYVSGISDLILSQFSVCGALRKIVFENLVARLLLFSLLLRETRNYSHFFLSILEFESSGTWDTRHTHTHSHTCVWGARCS